MSKSWLTLVLVPLCISCSDGADPDSPSAGVDTLESGPGAFDPAFETSDEFVTNMASPEEGLSSSPHGVMRIWYSSNLASILGADDRVDFVAPEGSVAIKTQSYDADGAYGEILVMIKQAEGTEPDALDWTFEVRSPDGELVGPSDPALCANCHSAFEENDGLPGLDIEN